MSLHPSNPSGGQSVQNHNTTLEVTMFTPSDPNAPAKRRQVQHRPDYGLVYDFLKSVPGTPVSPQELVAHLAAQGVPHADLYRGCLNWSSRIDATAHKRERYGVPGLVLATGRRGRFVYDPDAYVDRSLSTPARTVVVSKVLTDTVGLAPGTRLAVGTRHYPPVFLLATKDVPGRQVEVEPQAPSSDVPRRGDLLEVLDIDRRSRSAILKDENGNVVLAAITQVIVVKP